MFDPTTVTYPEEGVRMGDVHMDETLPAVDPGDQPVIQLNRAQRRGLRRAIRREYRANTRYWRRAWRGVMPLWVAVTLVKSNATYEAAAIERAERAYAKKVAIAARRA